MCAKGYPLALVYPSSSSANLDKRFTAKGWFKDNGDTFSREGGGGGALASTNEARHDSGRGRSTLAIKNLEEQQEVFPKFYIKKRDVDKRIMK